MSRIFDTGHQVTHLLGNTGTDDATTVQQRFDEQMAVLRMQTEQSQSLRPQLLHFLKVSESYSPHLFFCYQVPDLPRTNNDLEQTFGKVRAHERRATGRRGAIPGLVVRGTIRMQAALATRLHSFTIDELIPCDLQHWRDLRAEVSYRLEARRKQFRFRKDPTTYLTRLEAHLVKMSLRS
jgi:hypothetical protein